MHENTPWLYQLPNQLTLARLAVVPFLLVVYPLGYQPLKIFCAFVFLAAALTDALDGWLARKRKSVSALGALLDPIADKALIAASLVLLASENALWAWMIGVLLVRDIAISGVRMVALEQGFSIEVSNFGKLKTIAQGVMIFCLMINEPLWGWPYREVGWVAAWTSLFLSVYSGWQYCEEYLAKARQKGLVGKMFGG
jgi:CDP-diacylglycerol--glycerol-3-phosphate 3-phosphatidyltransferase